MQSSVVIKGSKAGMTVILNPDVPFEQLIEDIGKKFRESSRFWGSIQMTLTLEGRTLTPVSYTHLDVYKRQVRRSSEKTYDERTALFGQTL